MYIVGRGFARNATDTYLEFDIKTELRMGARLEFRLMRDLTIWEVIGFLCENFSEGLRTRVLG